MYDVPPVNLEACIFLYVCIRTCTSNQHILMSSEETDGLNVTIESIDTRSLYVATPQRMVRENACVVRNVSLNIACFKDLNQFDKFIKQINK